MCREMLVRNGMVVDWRESDGTFMSPCRLPSTCEKLETLTRANPFPREERITFDEATHTYTVDGMTVPRSATAFVHQFSSGFDARACIE